MSHDNHVISAYVYYLHRVLLVQLVLKDSLVFLVHRYVVVWELCYVAMETPDLIVYNYFWVEYVHWIGFLPEFKTH